LLCHSTRLNAASEDRFGISIDVVIPTFNGWRLLERCLTHLSVQTAIHRTIVVDNGSTDETGKNVRDRFPGVEVIELAHNVGFPSACNRGVSAGSGEAIVLLNNDVDAPPDFLEQIVAPLADDARVGSVASVLVRPGVDVIDAVGVTADVTLAGFPRLRCHGVGDARLQSPVLTGPVGAAGAYRRIAWEEVDGLDEGVLGYGEDLDLALRLRSAGWDAVLAPAAVAVHFGSASFKRRSSWQRYNGAFARGYFVRRYDLLHTKASVRALATETLVVVGDAVLSRDPSALRGRVAGWRSAKGLPRRATPPPEAIDSGISFRESIRLRRIVYAN